MTREELKARDLGEAITGAMGELRLAESLYKEIFPNGLAHCDIDFRQMYEHVRQARTAISTEFKARDAARGFKAGDSVYFYRNGDFIPGKVLEANDEMVCVDGNFPNGDRYVWKKIADVKHQEAYV